MQRKLLRATTKLTHFTVSKDERNTNEDNGKSLRSALEYCGVPKGTYQAEVTLNSEKIKPVALAVIELRLTEDIRQLVSHSVIRKFRLINFFTIPWQLFKSISENS